MAPDPARPDALDEEAVEAAQKALRRRVGYSEFCDREEADAKDMPLVRLMVAAYLAHADLVPRCECCGGTGTARLHSHEDYGVSFESETCDRCALGKAMLHAESLEEEQADLRAELAALRAECCACEKCGHVQAEPNWCHKCGHRTTMPEWARQALKAWKRRPSLQAAEESLQIARAQIGIEEERAERAEARCASIAAEKVAEIVAWLRDGARTTPYDRTAAVLLGTANAVEREFAPDVGDANDNTAPGPEAA